MESTKGSWADRIYRSLLRLFPFDFRQDYESEMEEVFREQLSQAAKKQGKIGLLRLWWETIAGIFRTAPSEHLSILRQDTSFAVRTLRKILVTR
jgi:hypothetical protein